MPRVPPVNATLTSVSRTLWTQAVDGTWSETTTTLWAGSASAFATSTVSADPASGVQSVMTERLVVPVAIPVRYSDHVTYVSHGEQRVRRVETINPKPDMGYVELFVTAE